MSPGPQAQKRGAHIPELDGLRGVAIAMVLLFHLRGHLPPAWHLLVALGWTGVELFFVLSGFLITRILLGSLDRPGYFRNFYIRRSLRIFPIYYLYLGAITLLYLATGRAERVQLAPYYFLYLQTVPQVLSRFTEGLPFSGQTWTLAIEEQFYWFWPFVVSFFRRRLRLVLITMVALAPILRLACVTLTDNPFLMHAWLPVQIDSLGAGALLALAVHHGLTVRACGRLGALFMVAGSLGIAATAHLSGGALSYLSVLTWTRMPHNALLLSATACLYAGLVAMAASAVEPLASVLRNPALVRLGRISYGLYLYHVAAFAVVDGLAGGAMDWTWAVVKVAVSWGIAELSFRFVESPLLALKESWASYRLKS